MRHLLVHLVALAAFAAALRGSGGALLRWSPLRRRLPGGAWHGVTAWTLGALYWTAGLFTLASIGRLGLGGMALVALPLGLVAILGERGDADAHPVPPVDRRERIALGLLCAVLLPTFLLTATPTVSTDADVYHLTLPRLFLEHGGFRQVEFNVYAHWPLATELFYAAALGVQDWILAKWLHFGCGLLVMAGLFVGARLLDEDRGDSRAWAVGGMAAAFFVANGVVRFELRAANVDLAHAAAFLVAFLALARARDLSVEQGKPWLLLAGLAAGLTASIKLPGIAWAAIVGVLYLPRLGEAAARRAFALCFILPVALLWTPWLIKSALLTGNPVYPFLWGVFGGPDWSVALGEQFRAWQGSIGMGRSPGDYLWLPLRVIFGGGEGYDHFDGELGRFWILLLPLTFFSRRRPLVRRALAVGGLGFVFWAATSQQMRFLVPLLPILALAGAVALADLAERLAPRRRGLALGLAFTLALGLAARVHGPLAGPALRTARTFMQVEAAGGDLLAGAVPPVFRWIDRELPADARLLFLNTNKGFFCRRDYLADSFFEASQIVDWSARANSPADIARLLEARRVTHLLLDRRPLGVPYPNALWTLLGDPRRAREIHRSPDDRFVVFALAPPDRSTDQADDQ